MKKSQIYLLLILGFGLLLGLTFTSTSVHAQADQIVVVHVSKAYNLENTPIPAVISPNTGTEVPTARELPPVGRNGGLILGASLLVLIIIGGVLGSRRRVKH